MEDRDEGDVCRICRMGAEPDNPLFFPCDCSGSIKYVHEDCLNQWLTHSGTKVCELCKHAFEFTPVYDPHAPTTLPTLEVFWGALSLCSEHIRFGLRVSLVVFTWLAVVPLLTSWVWQLFFVRSREHFTSLLYARFQLSTVGSDWAWGGFLAAVVIVVFLAFTSLRDYLAHDHHHPFHDHDEHFDAHELPPNPHALAQEHAAGPRHDHDRAPAPVGGDAAAAAAAGAHFYNDHHEEADRNPYAMPGHVPAANRHHNRPGDDFANPHRDGLAAHEHEEHHLPHHPHARDDAAAQGDAVDPFDVPDEMDNFEDLPFQELIGLRGPLSHLFENVVTVLASNTIFLGAFTLVPFTVGRLTIMAMWSIPFLQQNSTQDLFVVLVGYICLVVSLLIWIVFSLALAPAQMSGWSQQVTRHIISVLTSMYTLAKVMGLLVLELGVFPILCAVWLDYCTLDLLGGTWEARQHFCSENRLVCLLMHWVFGMIYMLHVALFVALLREIFRPQVLWFLRDPNDPNYHPFRDLFEESLFKHARRLVLSTFIYGPLVFLLTYLPVQFMFWLRSDIFPLQISFSETFLELPAFVLFGFISVPNIVNRYALQDKIRLVVRVALEWLGAQLSLTSYLFPAEADENEDEEDLDDVHSDDDDDDEVDMRFVGEFTTAAPRSSAADDGDATDMLASGGGVEGVCDGGESEGERGSEDGHDVDGDALPAREPVRYCHCGAPLVDDDDLDDNVVKPPLFAVRIALLLVASWLLLFFSLILLCAAPVLVGRGVLSAVGLATTHDLYAVCVSLVLVFAAVEVCAASQALVSRRQWQLLLTTGASWAVLVVKWAVAWLLLCIVLPLAVGTFLDLAVCVFFRNSWDESPHLSMSRIFSLGLVVCHALLHFPYLPESWKEVVTKFKADGALHIDIRFIVLQMAWPLLCRISFFLCVPYAVCRGLLPAVGVPMPWALSLWRVSHFVLPLAAAAAALGQVFSSWLSGMHNVVRDKKYKIGHRLHNNAQALDSHLSAAATKIQSIFRRRQAKLVVDRMRQEVC